MKLKGYSLMGIVCAIAIVVIILGSLASVSLYSVFRKESTITGSVTTPLQSNELNDNICSDDATVFFSYKIDSFLFNKVGNTYYQEFTADKMNYRPSECDYTIYINNNKTTTVKEAGVLSSQTSMLFTGVHGDNYAASFTLSATFYNNRTVFRIEYSDIKTGGYLNQMALVDFNFSIVESPITEKPHFESSGLTGLKVGQVLPTLYFNTNIKPESNMFANGESETIISGDNFSIICSTRSVVCEYINEYKKNDKIIIYSDDRWRFDYLTLPTNDFVITNISANSEEAWAKLVSVDDFTPDTANVKTQCKAPSVYYNVTDKAVKIGQLNENSAINIKIVNSKNAVIYEELVTEVFGKTIDVSTYVSETYTITATAIKNGNMYLPSNPTVIDFTIYPEDFLEEGEATFDLYINKNAVADITNSFMQQQNAYTNGASIIDAFAGKVFHHIDMIGNIDDIKYLEFVPLKELVTGATDNDFCLLIKNADCRMDKTMGSFELKANVLYSTLSFEIPANNYYFGTIALSAVKGFQNMDSNGKILFEGEYPNKRYYSAQTILDWLWLDNKQFASN